MGNNYFKRAEKSYSGIAYYRTKTFPCLLCKFSYGEVWKSGESNLLCSKEREKDYECFDPVNNVTLEKIVDKKRINNNDIEITTISEGKNNDIT